MVSEILREKINVLNFLHKFNQLFCIKKLDLIFWYKKTIKVRFGIMNSFDMYSQAKIQKL